MKNIFISYAHGDEFAARELRANLRNVEVGGLMDESDMAAGEALTDKIRESLNRANAVVVLISEHSLTSPWVQFEFGAADAMGKKVIPVLIGPAGIERNLPDWLQGMSYVDARLEPFNDVATKVTRAMSGEPA